MVTKVAEVEEMGVPTERVNRLKERLLQTQPQVSCERLRYLLEAYQESKG